MNNLPPKYVPRTPLERPPRVLKGSLASEKPPIGHKIHIFGERKLKFGMQAVERLIKCMPERFHTIGALGPSKGGP